MKFPKITIIIATYNIENTLEQTIHSVLIQTYSNIELVIIDGSSTDGTLEIIKKYEKIFDGRLKYISEKDKGIYDAWNKGILLSTGDWITFLGADDFLLQDFCMNYYNVINNNQEVNFISAMNALVTEDIKPIRFYGKPFNKNFKKYCTIAHVGSLHHKSLFLRFGKFDINFLIAGDYDFLLRARREIVPYFLPKLNVIVRDGGISNNNVIKVFKEQMKAKVQNNARMTTLCYYDFYIAFLKYQLRKILNSI
ncbi:glycosyltransferase [Flavobacterium sp. LS1R47]|uniref:Glycosyltransferase n=1 Tax=Flavobacterium frigoritolerans TaxID=2987686 RepID=A0A9X3C616_9FLAO|nr:glycosyltransferase family 2 protein [Flavobacterium frigoritolerans]MCV9931274.1 glycosyltransferase [Flavobacterium frigoritolerans]